MVQHHTKMALFSSSALIALTALAFPPCCSEERPTTPESPAPSSLVPPKSSEKSIKEISESNPLREVVAQAVCVESLVADLDQLKDRFRNAGHGKDNLAAYFCRLQIQDLPGRPPLPDLLLPSIDDIAADVLPSTRLSAHLYAPLILQAIENNLIDEFIFQGFFPAAQPGDIVDNEFLPCLLGIVENTPSRYIDTIINAICFGSLEGATTRTAISYRTQTSCIGLSTLLEGVAGIASTSPELTDKVLELLGDHSRLDPSARSMILKKFGEELRNQEDKNGRSTANDTRILHILNKLLEQTSSIETSTLLGVLQGSGHILRIAPPASVETWLSAVIFPIDRFFQIGNQDIVKYSGRLIGEFGTKEMQSDFLSRVRVFELSYPALARIAIAGFITGISLKAQHGAQDARTSLRDIVGLDNLKGINWDEFFSDDVKSHALKAILTQPGGIVSAEELTDIITSCPINPTRMIGPVQRLWNVASGVDVAGAKEKLTPLYERIVEESPSALVKVEALQALLDNCCMNQAQMITRFASTSDPILKKLLDVLSLAQDFSLNSPIDRARYPSLSEAELGRISEVLKNRPMTATGLSRLVKKARIH